MEILGNNELRIGNLVLDITENTTIVESIIPAHARIRYGVQLTSDWLLKQGFVPTYKDLTFIIGRFRFIYKPEYKYWYVLSEQELTYLTKIEFVHEFQNFIWIMDGKELNIK